MKFIKSIDELEKIYGLPSVASLRKVSDHITPTYRKWIQASSLCTLATVGPNGVDASPRGDNSNVVRELNEKNLLIPDWRGNNRIDSLRNIVNDPRASLMLIVGGANIVIRINGTAKITLDEELIESFEKNKSRITNFNTAESIIREDLLSKIDEQKVNILLKVLVLVFENESKNLIDVC